MSEPMVQDVVDDQERQDNALAVPRDAGGMIALALQQGASVDTLERLMVMRRELRAEQARDDYFRALSDFQAALENIPKTKQVMDRKDPRKVRYSYAPLEAIVAVIRAPLRAHGFSYRIETEQSEKEVAAVCVVHHTGGHSEFTRFAVPIDYDAYMNAAQKVASALTYSKRYALCDALGIVTADEDDDARAVEPETAAGQDRRPAPAPKPARPAPTSGGPGGSGPVAAEKPGDAQSLYTECVSAIRTLRNAEDKGAAFSLVSKHSQDAAWLATALESLKAGKVPSE